LAPGSYASVRLINADALIKLPDDLSAEQVVTVLTKGLTAWAGLNGFHQLKAGQTVLVQGASSSVGLLISRWARALGATVIGTVVGGPMAQHAKGPAIATATAAVFKAYREGVFGELEVTRYPLSQAAAAHEDIAARRKVGTAILVP